MSTKQTFAEGIKQYSLDELMEIRSLVDQQVDDLNQSIAEPMSKLLKRRQLLDQQMMVRLNESGGQSFTSASGANIHWRVTQKVSIGDAMAYWRFLAKLLEDGHPIESVFSGLQKRPSVEFVSSWAESHEGRVPDGINAFPERTLIFRKA